MIVQQSTNPAVSDLNMFKMSQDALIAALRRSWSCRTTFAWQNQAYFTSFLRLPYGCRMITFFEKKTTRFRRGVAKPTYKTVRSYGCSIVANQFFYIFTFAKISNNFLSPKDSRREIHNEYAISYVDTLGKLVNQDWCLFCHLNPCSSCTIIAKKLHDWHLFQ